MPKLDRLVGVAAVRSLVYYLGVRLARVCKSPDEMYGYNSLIANGQHNTVTEIQPSICRNCLAFCPILVTIEGGRAVKVVGDPTVDLYEGYSCPKGRALPDQHNDPNRLLHCLARLRDGTFAPMNSDAMVAEIAATVHRLVDRYGARSIAGYVGTGVVSHPTGSSMLAAFFRAIKSPMVFSASTIDKPAANTSTALHGNWVAGAQSFASSDTWIIVGGNPVISKSNGAPYNNPGQRLKEARDRGLKLIVIDPRHTETAKRAFLHIQSRPGEDPTILAAIINTILHEDLFDSAFVKMHSRGLQHLRVAVSRFTPEYAAHRAGVSADDLVLAARTFGGGKRGGVVCSTGPSFSTHSNLTYYLALCLNTLCGRWGRAGDLAAFPNMLLPAFTPKAQPYAPYSVFGDIDMRVRGLKENASGMPTSALSDEILQEGPGQVKALFCVGGNPMLAWPDQPRTLAAMKKLELLVVFDYRMTATADLAHYIVASPLSLEVPGATYFVESLKYIGVSRGLEVPWAQYTPKIVDPPIGSDLMDDRQFFFRLAQQLNLQLEWLNVFGYGPHTEVPTQRVLLDMDRVPTVDELIELTCSMARVPLNEVKRHSHGHLFEDVKIRIESADPDCSAKLELGNALMMNELDEVRGEAFDSAVNPSFEYLLISRRANNFMNSVGQSMPRLTGDKPCNPAFVHPDDMLKLGLVDGDIVRICSSHGEVQTVVAHDKSARRGVISMTHGFGIQRATGEESISTTGASITRLIGLNESDRITGIPRMSALPVAIAKVALS